MIDFDFDKFCYSCELCKKVCPTNAISMMENSESYLVPFVNRDLCINCNKCSQSCLHLNIQSEIESIFKAKGFAAYNVDESIRLRSSSGGIFNTLAKSFINNGNYVCGCIWDNNHMPTHIVSNTYDDIEKMMGSKYVQSKIGDCYEQIDDVLKSGKKVLFTGTPCQSKAILYYFKEHKNLYTMTVICHGVSSPKMWKDYLSILERKHGKLLLVSMRDKTIGWKDMSDKYIFCNNVKILETLSVDAFYKKAFIKGLIMKDRCLDCQYKGDYIKSNIIVGDFWVLPKSIKYIDDDKGISCILVNNSKGKEMIDSIESFINYFPVNSKDIIDGNEKLIAPAKPHPRRKQFLEDYRSDKISLNALLKKYIGPQNKKEKIRYMVKKGIKILGLYKFKHKISIRKKQLKMKKILDPTK